MNRPKPSVRVTQASCPSFGAAVPMRHMEKVLVALALVAAAGCVTPAAPGAPAADEIEAQAAAIVARDGCHQMHLHFPARVADFAAAAPPGFAIVPSDDAGVTTTLRIVASLCGLDGGGDAAGFVETWVEVPVAPPTDRLRAGDNAFAHYLALNGFVTDADAHAAFTAVGAGERVRLAEAHHAQTALAGAGVRTLLHLVTEIGQYEMETTLSADDGAFPRHDAIRWLGDADGIEGRILSLVGESESVGTGIVQFTYEGGDAAPPLAQGIAHEVRSASISHIWEDIA